MDFKELITLGFDEFLDELRESLEGLTPEERRYQATPSANHIDFTVWHMARVEDDWIQRFAQKGQTVWQRDAWHEKMGLPERESGFGYDADQVVGLPTFDFDDMMAYFDAVRVETHRYIDGLTESDLDYVPHPGPRPGYTIGKMFSHLQIEEAQHVGQVAYIRGLQRGINSQ